MMTNTTAEDTTQIKKNTVSAKNQLKDDEYISFINQSGKGKKVLFVGNSITRHGKLPGIGWNNDFGMAASSIDNDYVHILIKKINEKYPDSVFCICQASQWETDYNINDKIIFKYEIAREFKADIIIMRIIENCKCDKFNHNLFYKKYSDFIDYLNPKDAKIILTSGFWKHTGDIDIENVAKDNNYDFIYLGDLGEDDSMKAIGLFEHSGVAAHPNDNGMLEIANRISEKI